MTIAPVVKSVIVRVSPARAFALFTGRMGSWWPVGRTVGRNGHVDIVIEPRVGGRWFERDAEGLETDWGQVLAWEPPHRTLLAWRLDAGFRYDPALETEVELTFAPADGGGAVVTLEHRHLERYGDDAPRIAGLLGGGWPGFLADFAAFTDRPD